MEEHLLSRFNFFYSSLEASAPAIVLVSMAALVTMVVVVAMCACCKIARVDSEPDIIIAQATPSINVTNISSTNGQPAQVSHYQSGGEGKIIISEFDDDNKGDEEEEEEEEEGVGDGGGDEIK
ncbi:hypothetical protein FSP39_019319 [Pinctada imbricata]|uniref:Uncharacterized protein n=1 Tax=Pinctada imbricata TaxID=66713 RepID=A0AA88YEJ0_PINIB|nr:hypothetical protein FSP39_019319 [Pinctada imbricata]